MWHLENFLWHIRSQKDFGKKIEVLTIFCIPELIPIIPNIRQRIPIIRQSIPIIHFLFLTKYIAIIPDIRPRIPIIHF